VAGFEDEDDDDDENEGWNEEVDNMRSAH